MNEITGLRFVGYANHLRVNYGEPLPLFEPVAPEGRPSINTVEGWNALCEEQERRNTLYMKKCAAGA